MKRLIAVALAVGLLAGQVDAQALQYTPQAETQTSNSGGGHSNVVPIAAITSAVLAVGYVVFKVRRGKQARAARFNVYVSNKGN